VLLEESEDSISQVNVSEEYYNVFPEFKGASYSDRYCILLDRLVSEKLYSSACLMLSEKEKGIKNGNYNIPNEGISPKSLFLLPEGGHTEWMLDDDPKFQQFAGHIAQWLRASVAPSNTPSVAA